MRTVNNGIKVMMKKGGSDDDGAACAAPKLGTFNDRMHPRNIYRSNPPDFLSLSKKYPGLANHVDVGVNGAVKVAWGDPGARVEIARALLKEDFGIKWDFDAKAGNLCPSVARSLNYLHWIEDLIGAEADKCTVSGIDIGTGASAIFPILACAMHPNWTFIASDILVDSASSAQRIVEENGWTERVRVRCVEPDTLVSGLLENDDTHDFCMCNPPFFSKWAPSASGFQGVAEEKAAGNGGEVGFVSRLIDDSIKVKSRVAWFTSMLGRKESLRPLKIRLRSIGIPHDAITTTTLFQGKTVRWAIAWSFTRTRPKKQRERELVFDAPDVSVDMFCARVAESLSGASVDRGDDNATAVCAGNDVTVSCNQCSAGGVRVSIRGQRDNFTKFSARLKQDILRTNRRWRRKRKRGEIS